MSPMQDGETRKVLRITCDDCYREVFPPADDASEIVECPYCDGVNLWRQNRTFEVST
jgi:ribosomal protein S27E